VAGDDLDRAQPHTLDRLELGHHLGLAAVVYLVGVMGGEELGDSLISEPAPS
jgi:hypothetical protein